MTQNRWNVPAERPEIDFEENRYRKTRENLRSELFRERPNGESTDRAYDMVTGENESPIPEFLSFSRDECYHEVISANPMMISFPNSTRRSQRKSEPQRLQTQTQSIE